ACEKFRAAGLRAGYHNHQTEFTPLEGKRPIEVIAANTPKDFMLQLDVGTCVEMKSDPVASTPCTARTGRAARAKATRCSSPKAKPRGRRSSRQPNRSAASNTI